MLKNGRWKKRFASKPKNNTEFGAFFSLVLLSLYIHFILYLAVIFFPNGKTNKYLLYGKHKFPQPLPHLSLIVYVRWIAFSEFLFFHLVSINELTCTVCCCITHFRAFLRSSPILILTFCTESHTWAQNTQVHDVHLATWLWCFLCYSDEPRVQKEEEEEKNNNDKMRMQRASSLYFEHDPIVILFSQFRVFRPNIFVVTVFFFMRLFLF